MLNFTTVECAKICKVSPRTVAKWFDSGRLRGYRIPGTQTRRIPRYYLVQFLKEHGLPLPDELREDNQQVASVKASCDVSETATDTAEKLEAVKQEVASVLQLMDELAAQWGDEGVFRRCRDRLRVLVDD